MKNFTQVNRALVAKKNFRLVNRAHCTSVYVIN